MEWKVHRPGWRLPGSRQWWSVFGIGVALGSVVFGMRLLLTDAGASGGIDSMGAAAGGNYSSGVYRGVLPRPVHLNISESENRNAMTGDSRDPGTDGKSSPSGSDEADKPSGLEAPDNGGKQAAEDAAQAGVDNSAGKSDERADAANGPTGSASSTGSAGSTGEKPAASGQSALADVQVRVYLTDTGKVEKVPLETYVMGVLAGEMPIDFELEALKAQAIAARTYIFRRLASGENELAGRGADVTDTVKHQVYVSKRELDRRWEGEQKSENLAKLEQAVRETEGLVVTYEGEPIEAAFFSTSNGYTENSEDYWSLSLPYLRSVTSPWDKELSPRYEQETTFKLSKFYRLMGLSGKTASSKPTIKVIEKTEGRRIKTLRINGRTFTGREVRERLGLASSQFSWKIGKGEITFTTYGLGHGVGMSQWGANGMAQEGSKAVDILLHYYTGAKVEQASKLP